MINIGDVVQILNKTPCCGVEHDDHGLIFVVEDKKLETRNAVCKCGEIWGTNLPILKNGDGWIIERFCRKIPPLSELEGKETEEEAHV